MASFEYYAEPDLWKGQISLQDHVKDFVSLRELVDEMKTLGNMVIGPDVAHKEPYFTE